jgi:hypothetical protein
LPLMRRQLGRPAHVNTAGLMHRPELDAFASRVAQIDCGLAKPSVNWPSQSAQRASRCGIWAVAFPEAFHQSPTKEGLAPTSPSRRGFLYGLVILGRR